MTSWEVGQRVTYTLSMDGPGLPGGIGGSVTIRSRIAEILQLPLDALGIKLQNGMIVLESDPGLKPA